MKKQIVGLLLSMSVLTQLTGCAGTGSKPAIPVVGLGQIFSSGQYIEVTNVYSDSGPQPFYSLSGLTGSLTSKAAAEGAEAFLVTKSEERYGKHSMGSGYIAYVDGFGIKYKKAEPAILMGDVSSLASGAKSFYYYEVKVLMNLIQKNKMTEAKPLLYKALEAGKLSDIVREEVALVYSAMADVSDSDNIASLIKVTRASLGRNSLFDALGRVGKAQHIGLLVSIVKENNSVEVVRAAGALRAMKLKESIPEWSKLLNYHANDKIREIAASALLELGQRKEVEEFASKVTDPGLKQRLNSLLIK